MNKRSVTPSAVSGTPAAAASAVPANGRIVALGASAGGLDAFSQFLHAMPPDSGMAFVLVQHLDPEHASALSELLQRCTAMPVVEATDQMVVTPNRVHVIPPNRQMAIFHGMLQLEVPHGRRGQRLPIDTFLVSLATDCGARAVGIVLSGTGSDGTKGLAAIADAGGLCLAQEPASAKYASMPANAIADGRVHQVLLPAQMPDALLSPAPPIRHPGPPPASVAAPAEADAAAMNRVLMLLRAATGHDYALYKRSTVKRRVQRRMAVHGIAELSVYAQLLEREPAELQTLDQEMLVNVTGFFRDPEAFAALRSDVLPDLLADRPAGSTLRVWTAACASGEEAYSIAMLMREAMDAAPQPLKLQIYATDLDAEAIGVARAGVYPPGIAEHVATDRLARFFTEEPAGYRIRKELRDAIVFAVQDVIKDPPFTRLDLLSCRNLMIYLDASLQDRLLPVFHYALRPGGVLMLSPSESVGQHTDLFAPIDRKHKLYRASPANLATKWPKGRFAIDSALQRGDTQPTGEVGAMKKSEAASLAELARSMLLRAFAPASVLVDASGTMLYVHGETGAWLRPAPGAASLNIVDMARDELKPTLSAAIHGVASAGLGTISREVTLDHDGAARTLQLSVRPFEAPASEGTRSAPLLIVSFQEVATIDPPKRRRGQAATVDAQRIQTLTQELDVARTTLQSVVEEHQAYCEELKSANEELQSTNEELETSREEQQSVNEELSTVNNELQAKIEQLAVLQNDLKNLLDNVNVGTIFLDDQLVIRRFTREAQRLYRLVASDLGRRLDHIRSDIDSDALLADVHAVLESLVPRQRELRAADGAWYLARIQAYRTLDNVIQGVVLTFTDISRGKQLEEGLREALDLSRAIVDSVHEPLLVLDAERVIVSASRSFSRLVGVAGGSLTGRSLSSLDGGAWDSPVLRDLLDAVLTRDSSFDDQAFDQPLPGGGQRRLRLNARRVLGPGGKPPLILLAMQETDIPPTPGRGA